MPFTSLGLSDALLRAIHDKGYKIPSPIQQKAIPAVLSGQDVLAAAQTGTGKTAGFTLPLLQRLMEEPSAANRPVRALVLTPTRELAAQVYESVRVYGENLPLRAAVVFGGVNINPQKEKLRKGVDILVATPGRLLDLFGQKAVSLHQVDILVLDEADRMLDMGFIHDIRRILKLLPQRRQNLLFSATFSSDILKLADGLLSNPVSIEVAPRNTAAETVSQRFIQVDKGRKATLLKHLIRENAWEQVLVFTRTKHGANRLSKALTQSGIAAAAIHGDKSQNARTKALADFKANQLRVLVATDIAARGLDIQQLPHVVNYELPHVAEDYVHRIGRTGRAGASGEAVSFVAADEKSLMQGVEKLLKRNFKREQLEGFEPDPNAPVEEPKARAPRRTTSKPASHAAAKPARRGNHKPARQRNAQARKRSS